MPSALDTASLFLDPPTEEAGECRSCLSFDNVGEAFEDKGEDLIGVCFGEAACGTSSFGSFDRMSDSARLRRPGKEGGVVRAWPAAGLLGDTEALGVGKGEAEARFDFSGERSVDVDDVDKTDPRLSGTFTVLEGNPVCSILVSERTLEDVEAPDLKLGIRLTTGVEAGEAFPKFSRGGVSREEEREELAFFDPGMSSSTALFFPLSDPPFADLELEDPAACPASSKP